MKQISSKIKIQMKQVNIVNNNIERLVLNTIFYSFGILALLYVVLLGNMVRNIVERRGLETNALALASEVGNLELSYLSLSNGVDLARSHALGFQETKAIFTTRKALGLKTAAALGSVKMIQNEI